MQTYVELSKVRIRAVFSTTLTPGFPQDFLLTTDNEKGALARVLMPLGGV